MNRNNLFEKLWLNLLIAELSVLQIFLDEVKLSKKLIDLIFEPSPIAVFQMKLKLNYTNVYIKNGTIVNAIKLTTFNHTVSLKQKELDETQNLLLWHFLCHTERKICFQPTCVQPIKVKNYYRSEEWLF